MGVMVSLRDGGGDRDRVHVDFRAAFVCFVRAIARPARERRKLTKRL